MLINWSKYTILKKNFQKLTALDASLTINKCIWKFVILIKKTIHVFYSTKDLEKICIPSASAFEEV